MVVYRYEEFGGDETIAWNDILIVYRTFITRDLQVRSPD